jgi:hypothetical protein
MYWLVYSWSSHLAYVNWCGVFLFICVGVAAHDQFFPVFSKVKKWSCLYFPLFWIGLRKMVHSKGNCEFLIELPASYEENTHFFVI